MRLLLLGITVFLGVFTFAQKDVFEAEGIGLREIDRKQRVISAPKIIEPKRIENLPAQKPLVLVTKTKITYDSIEAASVSLDKLIDKLYPFYLKLGMGSTLMPMGELYVNSTRQRSGFYGLHVKHLSFFGDIKTRDKQLLAPAGFDKTDLGISFKNIASNYALDGSIDYLNDGFHYYGLANPSANKDSLAQRYHTVQSDFSVGTRKSDSTAFNVDARIYFRSTNTKDPYVDSLLLWKPKEQAFSLLTMGKKRVGNDVFHGSLGLRFNGYQYGILDSTLQAGDSGLVRRNTIIDLHPGVKSSFLNQKLTLDAGFNVSIDAHEKTRLYFFPKVSLQYNLVEDLVIPFITLEGEVKQNSLYALYRQNPYIQTNVTLYNEIRPYQIQLGVKGLLSKNLTYQVKGVFAKRNNVSLFITDTLRSSGNRFQVIYDSMNYASIEGNISYELSTKIKLDFIGRFHSYEMFHEAKAWNLPQWDFTLRGVYNLYDKLIAKLSLDMAFNRYGKVYGPGENIDQISNQYAYALGGIVDGNLGFEYRYNSRYSGFLNINNIISQRYLRFYNYPVMPIQIMAGITVKF
ncbi:MAG: hypothetical protein ACKO4K_07195 [Flavobacteriales bacterium]